MHRASIERRLDVVEASIPVKLPKVAIILQWPDGHCSHNGLDFKDMEEALDVLKPDEAIPVKVTDYSKPQPKAQGGQ